MNQNEIPTDLTSIAAFLNSQGYQTQIQPAVEPAILEQVLVALGQGPMHSDLVLRIGWVREANNLFGPPEFSEEYPDDFKFLQFLVTVPVQANAEAIGELSQHLLALNAAFDMAAFGLLENERIIFYRYVSIVPLPKNNRNILLAIVNSIQFLLEMFLPSILDVATGKKTRKELLKDANNELANIEFESMQ